MDTATKGVLIAAVVGLIVHFVKQAHDRRTELENELRAKRVEIYAELLQATQDGLTKTKSSEQVLRDASLTAKLIAWATPEVIRAFTDVWQMIEHRKASEKLESAVADLLAAIRKDLGHDDKQAGARFDELIARIYVNAAAQQIVGPERR